MLLNAQHFYIEKDNKLTECFRKLMGLYPIKVKSRKTFGFFSRFFILLISILGFDCIFWRVGLPLKCVAWSSFLLVRMCPVYPAVFIISLRFVTTTFMGDFFWKITSSVSEFLSKFRDRQRRHWQSSTSNVRLDKYSSKSELLTVSGSHFFNFLPFFRTTGSFENVLDRDSLWDFLKQSWGGVHIIFGIIRDDVFSFSAKVEEFISLSDCWEPSGEKRVWVDLDFSKSYVR